MYEFAFLLMSGMFQFNSGVYSAKVLLSTKNLLVKNDRSHDSRELF